MPYEKNLAKLQQSSQEIPEALALRKEKFEDAGYTYSFSPKERAYIKYNTLRNKRKQTELLDVIKIYMLKDESEGKLYYVAYVQSKVKDFSNNLVSCPITEVIGVVDEPQTNITKDEEDNPTDIELVETHNHYYKEFNKAEIEELFNKSRNSGNIACYVGYTRNPKTGSNDFIDNKRYIKNQKAFMEKSFEELMNLPEAMNTKVQYKDSKNKQALKYTKSRRNTMVNVNQPEGIEKRVKDNGQLWPADTEELTKQEEELAAKEAGQDGDNNEEIEETEAETKTTTKTETKTEERPNLMVGSGSAKNTNIGGTNNNKDSSKKD